MSGDDGRLRLDEVMRRMRNVTAQSEWLPPKMSKAEVADLLRRSDALGDCVPEPEEIDTVAGRVADHIAYLRMRTLFEQLRDGSCSDPEATKAEVVSWLHDEQDRWRSVTVAALGLPVRKMTGFRDHHVVVQLDGITVDPTCGPRTAR